MAKDQNEGSVELTNDTAERLVQQLDPAERVQRVARMGGGAVSNVYDLACSHPPRHLVLKLYPASEEWLMAYEAFVFDLLARNTDLPVPHVLLSDRTRQLVPRDYVLMSKIDGATVATINDLTDDDSRDIYRQMGRGLKALHELTFPKFGYIPHTAPVDGWETNAEFMHAWFSRQLKQFEEHGGDTQLAQSIAQRVHASESLFAACSTATFCHNDLHEGNVLVAKTGSSWQITGFIDVGGAIAADPLFDIGRTKYWSTRGNPLKHEALLEGYGPMRPGWEAALQVYGLYHALELRNWFAREGEYPDMVRHIERDLKRLAAVGSDSHLPGKRPM